MYSSLLLCLLPLVHAYSDTVPVAAWSSTSSLDIPTDAATNAATLLDSLLSHDSICEHDAVVFIDQPGLHASDLRHLPPSSALVSLTKSSKGSRQFPYVPSNAAIDVSKIAQSLSERCNARFVDLAPGMGGVSMSSDQKHVVCMNMPHLHNGHYEGRKSAVEQHDVLASAELNSLLPLFPSHLIIYAASSTPSFAKRQEPDGSHPTRPILETTPSESSSADAPEKPLPRPNIISLSSGAKVLNYASANTTLPEGGILKKYQLLSPGLIITLIITFGLLVPGVLAGVNAVSSIQSPLRVEAPKGFDALQKKSQ